MNSILLSLILGAAAGLVDVTPMLIQKLDRYAIASAFIQWVVLGFIITFIKIPGIDGWLKGLIIAVILSLPIVIIVAKNEPKSVIIILTISAVLGSIVGFLSEKITL